eukprot:3697216-Pleurochrysis_carterae.AAC.1
MQCLIEYDAAIHDFVYVAAYDAPSTIVAYLAKCVTRRRGGVVAPSVEPWCRCSGRDTCSYRHPRSRNASHERVSQCRAPESQSAQRTT